MGASYSVGVDEALLNTFVKETKVQASDVSYWKELLEMPFEVPNSKEKDLRTLNFYIHRIKVLLENDTGNLHSLIVVVTQSLESLLNLVTEYINKPDKKPSLDEECERATRGVFIIKMCLQFMFYDMSNREILWHIEQNQHMLGLMVRDPVDHEHECDIADITYQTGKSNLSQFVSPARKLATRRTTSPHGCGDDITDALLKYGDDNVTAARPDVKKTPSRTHAYLSVLARLISFGSSIVNRELVTLAVETILIFGCASDELESDSMRSLVLSPFILSSRVTGKHLAMGLLKLYVNDFVQKQAPKQQTNNDDDGLMGDLYSVLAMPWHVASYAILGNEPKPSDSIFHRECLLLLLLLINEPTCSHDSYGEELVNTGMVVFESFTDTENSEDSLSPQISFSELFAAVCSRMFERETVLLTYSLIHHNAQFMSYLCSRIHDFDQVMVPLLQQLYNLLDHPIENTYVIISMLLSLSGEKSFTETVFSLTLDDVVWFEPRVLNNVSIGDLLVIVLTRCITANLKETQDEYVHVSSLAILGNLAPCFTNLHAYAADRLIGLYCMASKQFLRLVESVADPDKPGSSFSEMGRTAGVTLTIINLSLTNRLNANANLIYSLLVHKDQFTLLKQFDVFSGEIENIDIVLQHFEIRLERRENTEKALSVQSVLDVIENGARRLPDNRLKKLPNVKFEYFENGQFNRFVLPYVIKLSDDHL